MSSDLFGGKATVCASCGAPVVWVLTAEGKRMPCEPAVLAVVTSGGKVVRGRESHFAYCPNAAEHRRKDERDE